MLQPSKVGGGMVSQPVITPSTQMSQAEGGRGDRSGGGVAQLRTRSNREETESQPGDWEAENREEHSEGRKGWWVQAREHGAGSRTRNWRKRGETEAAVPKAMGGERGREEPKPQQRQDLPVQIWMF